MILAVDIGNSNITIGLFENDSIVHKTQITSDINTSDDEYKKMLLSFIANKDIDAVIVASVVEELNDRFCLFIEELLGIEPVFISPSINMNIKIKLKNNNEIGADRIVNGSIGYELYHKPIIIVDCGTATTFDIINSNGEYIGGIILPGIKTQLKTLYKSTSKLPLIEIEDIEKFIGNDTKSAILSGIINGNASLIDGMIQKCISELKETPALIATGGLSRFITKYTTTKFDLIDENLTLKGINYLYKINSKVE